MFVFLFVSAREGKPLKFTRSVNFKKFEGNALSGNTLSRGHNKARESGGDEDSFLKGEIHTENLWQYWNFFR